MQAITTRYAGPTNRLGSRFIVSAGKGRPCAIVAYDHALDVGDNHRAAALVLLARLGWDADGRYALASGSLDGTHTYAHRLVLA